MKTLLIICLIFISACGSPKTQQSDAAIESTKKSQNTIVASTPEMTQQNLEAIVGFLASDELQGRDTGSEGIDQAATFIETRFKAFGISPYYKTFRDDFKAKELNAFNIVGFLEGNDPELKKEVVILGAHYDHIGSRAKLVGDDAIGNGANDNASGTATVLAMAKYFGAKRNNKRSIMFTLFSAEEMGLLGSKHLAKKLKNEELNLYTMVNFEMTGVPFTDNRDYVAFVSGYDLSNMAEKLNTYVGSNLIGKSEVAVKYSLFKRSDNYPFYQEFGLPCQTISTCDLTNFDFYHHVDDEADKMDYKHMESLIKKLVPAVEGLCNAATQEIRMNEE